MKNSCRIGDNNKFYCVTWDSEKCRYRYPINGCRCRHVVYLGVTPTCLCKEAQLHAKMEEVL